MNTYTPTIGLEVHAELNTQSKMFCGCTNNPDETIVNKNVCPVCTAHPGTLPVVNKHAVLQVLRVGSAIGGTIADFTEFDRKNYFYPDIPKNYQISQYKYPLVSGGKIGPVSITRIHLEEDTARSSHGTDTSAVDFNRSGVPLMELVTEPVIHDAQTAVRFARDLRLLLRYLEASHANLEKGEMRIEANISIAPEGETTLGTKVEVKNLNSFKAVEQAIAYEIKRHTDIAEKGETLVQETRGWDENKQKTFSQRIKEDSHDYRYFPDPDVPKFQLSEMPQFSMSKLRSTLPELPWEKMKRYVEEGLKPGIAEVLVGDISLNRLYESATRELSSNDEKTLAANYLTSDVLGTVGSESYRGRMISDLDGSEFAQLIQLASQGDLSSRGVKDTLTLWLEMGGSPRDIAKTKGLMQISDSAQLNEIVETILKDHPDIVEDYKAGKTNVLQYLIGQGMKATKGAANPDTLGKLFVTALTED